MDISLKIENLFKDLKDKLMKSAKEGGYVDSGKVAQILNKEIDLESVQEHSGNDAEDDEGKVIVKSSLFNQHQIKYYLAGCG